jgi:hypothetical protein
MMREIDFTWRKSVDEERASGMLANMFTIASLMPARSWLQ